ncbi:MAG: DNA polymerase I [Candidatus Moranbacteria bacterium]|nr:DNA polymerase I [Candidatus Moranbacteria bacterium]
MTEKLKTLVLLDCNAIVHRAFHAIPPLSNKNGEPMNAVYGFSSTLLSVLKEFDPEYVVASFDLPAPTFRHSVYKEYKATRAKAPDELYAQFPFVRQVVSAFGIPIFEKKGFEADDILGTIASLVPQQHNDVRVVIVTGDMDTLQLVTDKVFVFTMRRGIMDTVLYDVSGVEKKYGLVPGQLPDFKGLRGDPSDNIPGVKGVGEKTASTLLQKYGTLGGVYEHLDEISGSVHDKLKRDRAQAFLSKELGTIKVDVPLDFDLSSASLSDFSRPSVVSLFRDFGFKSLVKRLPSSGSEVIEQDETPLNSFSFDVYESSDVSRALERLGGVSSVVVDGVWKENLLEGVVFCLGLEDVFFLSLNDSTLLGLKSFFENEAVKKSGYDMKRLYKYLYRFGVVLSGVDMDVLVAAYVVHAGSDLSYENLMFSALGEEVSSESSSGQMSLSLPVSSGEEWRRSCERGRNIFRLCDYYRDELVSVSKIQGKEHNLLSVFRDVDMPLIPILARMESVGIGFDRTVFDGISETVSRRLSGLEKDIYSSAGKTFNINSPKQLAVVLFEDLNISSEGVRRTKTGISTASSELAKIVGAHPIVSQIEEYRELSKLKNTYVDVLPDFVFSDGRIHSTFHQTVTTTGRLSSSDPNLQNIPVRGDLSTLLRTAFVAPSEFVLVSADYSQIDLRCAAHLSDDKKMQEAFRRGDDIHTLTACEVFDVSASKVTKTMRRHAKALNFGVIYGMGAFGFSASAGVSLDEARDFIDRYFGRFSGVATYMQSLRDFAKKHGYVETAFGRRRYLPDIHSPNMQVSRAAERMAINMPVQGLTADIMRLAMIVVDAMIRDEFSVSVRMILQVHDELIFEVREDVKDSFLARVSCVMEGVYPLKVPMTVDVSWGVSWAEL